MPEEQIKNLRNWYRNLLAHQAIIMPGTQLSDDPDGTPIELNSAGEPTHIRVIPLCQVVKRWWEGFDRSRINPELKQKRPPKTGVPTTTSPLPGVSGCYVTSTTKP